MLSIPTSLFQLTTEPTHPSCTLYLNSYTYWRLELFTHRVHYSYIPIPIAAQCYMCRAPDIRIHIKVHSSILPAYVFFL
jgi:hypothetical protein